MVAGGRLHGAPFSVGREDRSSSSFFTHAHGGSLSDGRNRDVHNREDDHSSFSFANARVGVGALSDGRRNSDVHNRERVRDREDDHSSFSFANARVGDGALSDGRRNSDVHNRERVRDREDDHSSFSFANARVGDGALSLGVTTPRPPLFGRSVHDGPTPSALATVLSGVKRTAPFAVAGATGTAKKVGKKEGTGGKSNNRAEVTPATPATLTTASHLAIVLMRAKPSDLVPKDDLLYGNARDVFPPQMELSQSLVSAAIDNRLFAEVLMPGNIRDMIDTVTTLAARAPGLCESGESLLFYTVSSTFAVATTGPGKGKFTMRPIRVADTTYPQLSSFLGTHISHRPRSLDQVVQRNFLNPAGTDTGIVVAVQVYADESEEEEKKAGSESESETEGEF